MVSCCIYRSISLVPARSTEAASIYLAARELNPRVGITGYLHQEEGHFVQFIEGPEWSIDALLQTIATDPRHTSMTILRRYEAETRTFENWDMAFTCEEMRRFGTWCDEESGRRSVSNASAGQLLEFMLDRSAQPLLDSDHAATTFA